MSKLTVTPNLSPSSIDDIYHWLLSAHEGLSDAESMRFNARLILLLVNAIGDPQLIREAVRCAARTRKSET